MNIKHKNIEKQNVCVIGDMHGSYKELNKLLEVIDKDTKIIFLGDYIDRGDNSLETIHIVMDLVEKGKAIALMGNHEKMFLDFLDGDLDLQTYLNNGGNTTIKNFLDTNNMNDFIDNYGDIKNAILNLRKEEIGFIRNLDRYCLMDNYMFVHAGVSPKWKSELDFVEEDLLWIRKHFHYSQNIKLPYTIFFGHTPTRTLYEPENVWISPYGKRIGIDGGCVFGHHLFGVILNPNEHKLQIHKIHKSDKNGHIIYERLSDIKLEV